MSDVYNKHPREKGAKEERHPAEKRNLLPRDKNTREWALRGMKELYAGYV
jgi:hypothetical protein